MKGIRQDKHGYQAFLEVRGQWRSKRFPFDTPIREMQLWRDETRLRILGRIAPQPEYQGDTFADDVRTYLGAISDMPSFRSRQDDMALWVQVFGRRPRHTLTALEIRSQLARWRKAYAANTVNHRRTALMHFFTVLNGKGGANPVREVPRYRDDSQDAPPRALSQAAIDWLLDAMPASQTKARLVLFRWTGWPPAQMARLQPSDVRWDEGVYVRPRRKGKGAAGVWLPLLPQAWAALREFSRLRCWADTTRQGHPRVWSTSSARKSLRLASRKARRELARAYAARTLDRAVARALRRELLDVTPYQLRHSFGTLVAQITKDDRAVQVLLQHADVRQTHRYTKMTADPRAAAALTEVARALKSTG